MKISWWHFDSLLVTLITIPITNLSLAHKCDFRLRFLCLGTGMHLLTLLRKRLRNWRVSFLTYELHSQGCRQRKWCHQRIFDDSTCFVVLSVSNTEIRELSVVDMYIHICNGIYFLFSCLENYLVNRKCNWDTPLFSIIKVVYMGYKPLIMSTIVMCLLGVYIISSGRFMWYIYPYSPELLVPLPQ